MLPGELDGKRAVRALERLGWVREHVRGSHIKFRGPDGRMMILAHHGTISRPVLLRTLRQAGISEADFERVLR